MKEKSYTELMKLNAMKRKRLKEAYVLDLYIDMLLREAHLKWKRNELNKKIDEALDQNNKALFQKLSEGYIELTKQFGS